LYESAEHEIERGSQIVNGVPDDGRELLRDFFAHVKDQGARPSVAVLAEVLFDHDSVWAPREKYLDLRL
jgi:hypothetical protein